MGVLDNEKVYGIKEGVLYKAKLYRVKEGFLNEPKLSESVFHRWKRYMDYAEIQDIFEYMKIKVIVEAKGRGCAEFITGVRLPLIEQFKINAHTALRVRENGIHTAAILSLIGDDKSCLIPSDSEIEKYVKDYDNIELFCYLMHELKQNKKRAEAYVCKRQERLQRILLDEVTELEESGDYYKKRDAVKLKKRLNKDIIC